MLSLRDRCANIELLVLDVDGVLTCGEIIYASRDEEIKAFHVRDGSGLKIWHEAGKTSAIITGRQSELVTRRGRELGIKFVFQGASNKAAVYRQLLQQVGTTSDRVCCIGDDVVDLPLLSNCGLAVAVADGCTEARSTAHYVTQVAGGRGAVREVIEVILRCQGCWQPLVDELRRSLS